MNENSFLRYVEKTRDCEHDLLDAALKSGLHRVKNDRFDSKKLFMLAAASVFTFAMCLTVNLIPFTPVIEGYYRNRQKTMPVSSEVLNGYVKDITSNLDKYLGGE
ncbi:MAG: hypothetical protein LBH42_09855 [Treponema sp.]|jgi:hypothetical protein|nr:hypothetical protein [Treponema sp.]